MFAESLSAVQEALAVVPSIVNPSSASSSGSAVHLAYSVMLCVRVYGKVTLSPVKEGEVNHPSKR